MTVLVFGATGAQGGAVIASLLESAQAVRAVVRDPAAPAARRLKTSGAEVVRGDLDDPASLRSACDGVRGVFSVQLADHPGRSAERRQAANLIAAALAAGVGEVVHASVSATGWRAGDPGRGVGDVYWDSKEAVEAAMRSAGFASLTILKPAFMMENFIAPKAARMFPDLPHGEILTAVEPSTPVALVAASDIGAAAAAAFDAPGRFAGAEIELAGDVLTLPEAAAVIAEVTGRPLEARTLAPEALAARGQARGWIDTQRWLNEVGYPARPSEMRSWGLEPTTFEAWARAHRPELVNSLAESVKT